MVLVRTLLSCGGVGDVGVVDFGPIECIFVNWPSRVVARQPVATRDVNSSMLSLVSFSRSRFIARIIKDGLE